MACDDEADCNNRGICVSSLCECDPYMAGPNCETPYRDIIGAPNFEAWRFIFLSLFLILLLVVSYHLYVYVSTKKITTLRGVTNIFLWIVCFLSVLYFATDPMAQKRNIPYLLEQILFGFQIFFIFMAYLTLLLFWIGAYHSAKQGTDTKGWLLKSMRPVFAVAVTIWFVLDVCERVVIGLQLKLPGRHLLDTLYNYFIGLVSFVFSGTMIVYGVLMIRQFTRSATTGNTALIKKITIICVVVSSTLMLSVVLTLIIVITGLLNRPQGSMAALSIIHAMFFILTAEMAFFMKPTRRTKRIKVQRSTSVNPIMPVELNASSSPSEPNSDEDYTPSTV